MRWGDQRRRGMLLALPLMRRLSAAEVPAACGTAAASFTGLLGWPRTLVDDPVNLNKHGRNAGRLINLRVASLLEVLLLRSWRSSSSVAAAAAAAGDGSGPATMSVVLFLNRVLFSRKYHGHKTLFHRSQILVWKEQGPPTLQSFLLHRIENMRIVSGQTTVLNCC